MNDDRRGRGPREAGLPALNGERCGRLHGWVPPRQASDRSCPSGLTRLPRMVTARQRWRSPRPARSRLGTCSASWKSRARGEGVCRPDGLDIANARADQTGALPRRSPGRCRAFDGGKRGGRACRRSGSARSAARGRSTTTMRPATSRTRSRRTDTPARRCRSRRTASGAVTARDGDGGVAGDRCGVRAVSTDALLPAGTARRSGRPAG